VDQRLTVVTLGVADLGRARRFYEAIGWTTACPTDSDVVFFQSGGMVLALWNRNDVAKDCNVELGTGFGGVNLARNLGSPAEVDTALAEAQAAGATVSRAAGTTFWGGYSGVFLDPDGHPWEIAHNPHWTLSPDGSVFLGT